MTFAVNLSYQNTTVALSQRSKSSWINSQKDELHTKPFPYLFHPVKCSNNAKHGKWLSREDTRHEQKMMNNYWQSLCRSHKV
jgi:hypothetical protein